MVAYNQNFFADQRAKNASRGSVSDQLAAARSGPGYTNSNSRFRQLTGKSSVNTLQGARNSANAANEKRYQEILGNYDQMTKNAEHFGNFERNMIDRRTAQGNASDAQGLISKGLYNTTTQANLQRGRDFDANLANMGVGENVLQQLNQILGGKSGAIERRTDLGPSDDLISRLSQALGQSGASLPNRNSISDLYNSY
tara:strand:- start:30217 stop:30810 length:594 start_codon:yes stop_codon:yes gene_type:complete